MTVVCMIVLSNDKHSCIFHLQYFDLKALKLKEYLESGIRQFQVRCLPVKSRSVTWNKNTGNRDLIEKWWKRGEGKGEVLGDMIERGVECDAGTT